MLSITNVLIFAEYLQYKTYFALAHSPCSPAPFPMFCFISTDIGAHNPRLLAPFAMNIETALLGLNNALWFCFSCHTLICVKKVYWLYQSEDVCTRILVHFLFKSLPVHHLRYDLCNHDDKLTFIFFITFINVYRYIIINASIKTIVWLTSLTVSRAPKLAF